jgi:hypothetical protein
MRLFNTSGPCNPELHYMVPPELRLSEARRLIEEHGYFVVHASQPMGKSTTLRALIRALTREGRVPALHFSCETAKVVKDDFGAAEKIILEMIRIRANSDLPPDCAPGSGWPPESPPGARLYNALGAWARTSRRPLVLAFDEIDALQERSLQSVLGQLRAGFNERPQGFPASVILIGLRDVRDYTIASGGSEPRLGTSSPFNVKLTSLRIGNLSEPELRDLYAQHTSETGQPFTESALRRAFDLTGGQPWLVNALAREAIEEIGIAPPTPIESTHLDEAKERLILARQTHLDSLVAKLHEPRVRRIIEPLLAGRFGGGDPTYDDDASYVVDLGLVAPGRPLRIANPIYKEVIVRVLGNTAEIQLEVPETRAFVKPDGCLDFRKLLEEFAAFWREHGEVLAGRMTYHEMAPQLVLMAYLQRVVNSGGYIDREYGAGRGRIDLLIRWPYLDAAGRRQWQREAAELKVWAEGKPDPLAEGLRQLDGYLTQLGLHHGVLVTFDRRAGAPPAAERTRFDTLTSQAGCPVTVLWA